MTKSIPLNMRKNKTQKFLSFRIEMFNFLHRNSPPTKTIQLSELRELPWEENWFAIESLCKKIVTKNKKIKLRRVAAWIYLILISKQQQHCFSPNYFREKYWTENLWKLKENYNFKFNNNNNKKQIPCNKNQTKKEKKPYS